MTFHFPVSILKRNKKRDAKNFFIIIIYLKQKNDEYVPDRSGEAI
ncbi:MAG: hypothetical protein JWQ40_4960 [Segetibacter sp.]|nr:hypothetical protein [Segetibacter sp.]